MAGLGTARSVLADAAYPTRWERRSPRTKAEISTDAAASTMLVRTPPPRDRPAPKGAPPYVLPDIRIFPSASGFLAGYTRDGDEQPGKLGLGQPEVAAGHASLLIHVAPSNHGSPSSASYFMDPDPSNYLVIAVSGAPQLCRIFEHAVTRGKYVVHTMPHEVPPHKGHIYRNSRT